MDTRRRLPRVEGSIVIERPVEAVFDFVADERNEPQYNRRMRRAEQVTAGPIGPGTRFHAELSSWPRPTAMEVELTGYERPRLLASHSWTRSMDIWGRLTFTRVPAGTVMKWSWELQPHGVLRWLQPLAARIGRRQERETWARLRGLLERGSPDSAQQLAPPSPTHRSALAAAAVLVAGSAVAGAVRLASAPDDEIASLRHQLPLQSTGLAALGLTGAVTVPYGVLAWLAWRADARTDAVSVAAGASLLGWLGLQLALLEERSLLQPLFASVGLGFVVVGARNLRARRCTG